MVTVGVRADEAGRRIVTAGISWGRNGGKNEWVELTRTKPPPPVGPARAQRPSVAVLAELARGSYVTVHVHQWTTAGWTTSRFQDDGGDSLVPPHTRESVALSVRLTAQLEAELS